MEHGDRKGIVRSLGLGTVVWTGHASSFFRVFREHGRGADTLRVRGRGGLEQGHNEVRRTLDAAISYKRWKIGGAVSGPNAVRRKFLFTFSKLKIKLSS